LIGEDRANNALVAGRLDEESLDLIGVEMANLIGGTSRPLDLAKWMSTPEGRVLMQFHSIAFNQTRVFKDLILKPAFRKEGRDVRPLISWMVATGVSVPAMVALTSGMKNLFGQDPPEYGEADNAGLWAWNILMMMNMTFSLGLIGDFAAGFDTPQGVTPLVGTMTGPTVNSIASTIVDLGEFVGTGDEDKLKNIPRREVSLLNWLAKSGAFPILEKRSDY
jgi:hypothetical protein